MRKGNIFVCMMASALLTSCASILSGKKAKVTLKSDLVTTPVDITYDDKKETDIFLPYTIKVRRGYKPTVIKASAEGYDDANYKLSKKFNSTTLGNIVLGGIPGIAIDAATGSITKPETKVVILPFKERKTIPQELVQKQPSDEPERVVRENPGRTSLERTVIRWCFESEPKGARIFWRVVSSVPDEVKNTNELYLGTTPYEDTRSFNIIGLTEENARNVQIEIKMRRQGYIDQTKRFNVRQAIDQQEISSFFDMVKDE